MKSVLKNYLFSVLYQLFSIIIPLITTPYLSRVLGVNGIGSYAYEFSIASYFTLAILLGLKNYGSKVIAGDRDSKKALSNDFWNIYMMQICMMLFVLVIYIIYGLALAKNRRLVCIFILLLFATGGDITWFFSGIEEFRITVSRDFLIKSVTTILIFVLLTFVRF